MQALFMIADINNRNPSNKKFDHIYYNYNMESLL